MPCSLGSIWFENNYLIFLPSNTTSFHGTMIQTGVACKKISCYIGDSAYRWLIVENANIFQSYVKHL